MLYYSDGDKEEVRPPPLLSKKFYKPPAAAAAATAADAAGQGKVHRFREAPFRFRPKSGGNFKPNTKTSPKALDMVTFPKVYFEFSLF